MARIRTVKPEFWDDEKTGTMNPFEKCLLLGMLCFADDEGLVKAHPQFLKSKIFPYDTAISIEEIEKTLSKFSKEGLVFLYQQNNQSFAWIIKFRVHQRIDKPQKAQNPCPSTQNGKYRDAIFKRDGFKCHLCGDQTIIFESNNICKSKAPSVDHIISLSKGGSDYPSNLKTACISCNKSRGNKSLPADSENNQGTILEEDSNTAEHSESIPGTFLDGKGKGKGKGKGEEKKDIVRQEPPDTLASPRGEIINYFNAVTKRSFKPNADITKRHLDARIKEGWNLADFKAVIDSRSKIWGSDPKMHEYLRPETVFGTKFESYLQATKAPNADGWPDYCPRKDCGNYVGKKKPDDWCFTGKCVPARSPTASKAKESTGEKGDLKMAIGFEGEYPAGLTPEEIKNFCGDCGDICEMPCNLVKDSRGENGHG